MITAFIVFIALEHLLFMLLETVLWQHPLGRRIFGSSEEFARKTAKLAANQGLYNGFLASGLVFGLLHPSAGQDIVVFFLVCVLIAGVFGALTVNRLIFLYQGMPAAITLGLISLHGTGI